MEEELASSSGVSRKSFIRSDGGHRESFRPFAIQMSSRRISRARQHSPPVFHSSLLSLCNWQMPEISEAQPRWLVTRRKTLDCNSNAILRIYMCVCVCVSYTARGTLWKKIHSNSFPTKRLILKVVTEKHTIVFYWNIWDSVNGIILYLPVKS